MSFEYGNNGYIGEWLCGADGVFSPVPQVVLNFSKSHPNLIPGLTITWSTVYGEWATEFRVSAYHKGNTIFTQTVENDSTETVVAGDILGYDKITIDILKWSKPFHRARIQKILPGIEKVYTKTDIMSYSAEMSVDPLTASLPKSEITFELKNLNGEFSRDNPKGLEKYLMTRQAVRVRYGYKLDGAIEWIPGGTYYLSEWEGPQNGITASFTARDAIEFMTDPYTGPSSGTLLSIATAAFEQAELPRMPDGSEAWTVASSMGQISAPATDADGKPLDLSKISIAEVLQYVANAGCCVLYQGRDGMFHVEHLDYSLTDYPIDRFNSYANAEIKRSKQLKAMNINNGQFTLTVGRDGETQPVVNPLINSEQAKKVAAWAADYLQNRRIVSGNYRADPRLDPMDVVRNETKYYTAAVIITTVKYSYNGAFRGSYEGRGLDSSLSISLHSGEPLAISGITFPTAGG